MIDMKKIFISIVLIGTLLLAGCDQYVARNFGGSYTLELPEGEKLVNVTWKDDSLWYLTEPMEDGYEPKEYKFEADTVFGVFEGTVTIVESR